MAVEPNARSRSNNIAQHNGCSSSSSNGRAVRETRRGALEAGSIPRARQQQKQHQTPFTRRCRPSRRPPPVFEHASKRQQRRKKNKKKRQSAVTARQACVCSDRPGTSSGLAAGAGSPESCPGGDRGGWCAFRLPFAANLPPWSSSLAVGPRRSSREEAGAVLSRPENRSTHARLA